MYDVITVGSATVDVFAKTHFSELIKIINPKGETDLLAFPSGAKILIDELEFSTGGGGTNTAVAFSRLGHKTGFIGKLGQGTNSEFIHKKLVREKVDLLCGHGTGNAGYSVILDALDHDRTILAYKGVNDQLKTKDVPFKKMKTKWLYFSAMMGESFNTLEKIAEFASENKIRIAFNTSAYLAEKGKIYLKNVLSRTDILVLNKEEAALIAGDDKIDAMLVKLRMLGPKIVVITDGKRSLCVIHDRHIYSAFPPPVKIIDATGAGDAFAASFLSGIIRKGSIEASIRLGVANAQSVLGNYGAKNKLLGYKAALKAANKLRMKIHRKKIQ